MALTRDQYREIRYLVADMEEALYRNGEIEFAVIQRSKKTDPDDEDEVARYDIFDVAADLLVMAKLDNSDFTPERVVWASERAAQYRLKTTYRLADGTDTPAYPNLDGDTD